MKTNYSKQLIKGPVKSIEDAENVINYLFGHVQSLTDTINQIVAGGLSLSRTEKNLPLTLIKASVTSGISRTIPGYGAAIVFVSDNAIVDKFAYRTISENLLEITILFDDDKTHEVVFLAVNEKLPSI